MKSLFFDIDGTILKDGSLSVKPTLAEGRFEQLLRQANFERIVCVSNLVASVHLLTKSQMTDNGPAIIFRYCQDAFTDQAWFESHVTLVDNPAQRVHAIPLNINWWYVDDLADYYFEQVGLQAIYQQEVGHRICLANKDGTGEQVAAWLQKLSSSPK